jgi:hypothetical protein
MNAPLTAASATTNTAAGRLTTTAPVFDPGQNHVACGEVPA